MAIPKAGSFIKLKVRGLEPLNNDISYAMPSFGFEPNFLRGLSPAAFLNSSS